MKNIKYKIFPFLLIFISFCACAQKEQKNETNLFWQGNKLYKQEDMTKALATYNNIPEKGYSVWFNMGNSAYYVPDYAHAILFWRRAQKQAQSLAEFDAAQQHITAARTQLGLSDQENMFMSMCRRVVKTISPLLVQLLFLVCSGVLLMLSGAWLNARRYWLFAAVATCWLLLSLIVLLHYSEQTARGIVVAEQATLYGTAHDAHTSLGTLKLGEEVTIRIQKSEWYKISGQHACGWVAARDIEII